MIRMLSLFSGIGAFEAAMKRIGMPHEVVGFSEIDKYAIRSYCAAHGIDEALNLGDITKIDVNHLPNDIDLITYGFPCQDISNAGKMKGMFNADGTQTRSGLFFDALRIIEETQPKIAIAENVKNLTSKKFKLQFDIVLRCLEAAGYNNYWKVLNAKDYGIPQNRERVFIVSIRKDIDTGTFEFPQGFPLELKLKDLLEDEVDEKYYISDVALKGFAEHARKQKEKGNSFHAVFKDSEDIASTLKARYYKDGSDCLIRVKEATKQGVVCDTLLTRDYKDPKYVPVEPVRLCNIYGEQFGTGYAGNVWDKECISPTLMTMQGGNRQPLITVDSDSVIVREATKKGYTEAFKGDSINLEQPNSKTRRGRVGKQVAQTLTTSPQQGVVQIGNCMPTATSEQRLRIRKLTPKECWRLMGFDDSDFEKAEKVNSNTQLYKQAGNSIVVDVLVYLLRNIKELTYEEKIQDSKI